MQSRSETWRALWESGAAKLEARATIAGTVYTDISAPVIARALMPEGLSAGNAVSASCAFTLREPGDVPKAAAVLVEARLTDGETASEWLPQGAFYVSRRAFDPVTGRLTLECYDALLKANALWTPSAGSWPRAMTAVAAELAALIGAEQDPRNALDDTLMMPEPAAGATLRDALGTIAAAHGGNWIISPEGKLRLVPLIDADADAATVPGVLGRMDAGTARAITGVRCETEDGAFLAGDETGAVVTLKNGLPAWATALREAWEGATWQAFELSGALVDPAAEPGDALLAGAGGEVDGVLCGETITLGPLCRAGLSAPGPEEVADEYPYIGASAKALSVAKAYAREVVDALDDDLTQLEIFNRLTGNGVAQGMFLADGQLYVNASYINTGELSADRINGGTLTLGGVDNGNGTINLLDESGNTIGAINNDGIDMLVSNGHFYVNKGIRNHTVITSRRAIRVEQTVSGSTKPVKIDIDNGKVVVTDRSDTSLSGNDKVVTIDPGGVSIEGYGSVFDPDAGEGVYVSAPQTLKLTNSGITFTPKSTTGFPKWFSLSADSLMYLGKVSLGAPLPIDSGGTGGATAAEARENLEVPMTLQLTGTTWADLYDELTQIPIGHGALVNISDTAVTSVLSGGQYAYMCRGMIFRLPTAGDVYDIQMNIGVGTLYSWRIEGLTSASATPKIDPLRRYAPFVWLSNNDTTWADLWKLLAVVPASGTSTVYVNGTPATMITGGVITAACDGFVARYGSGLGFNFILVQHSTGELFNVVVTFNSAHNDATVGTVYTYEPNTRTNISDQFTFADGWGGTIQAYKQNNIIELYVAISTIPTLAANTLYSSVITASGAAYGPIANVLAYASRSATYNKKGADYMACFTHATTGGSISISTGSTVGSGNIRFTMTYIAN